MEKNGTSASPAMALASSVLPQPGLAHQQHAARNPPAEALELPRVLEELDDLVDFLLGLVDAGHVVERDVGVLLGGHAVPRPPEAAQEAAAAAHGRAQPAEQQEVQQQHEHHRHQQLHRQAFPPAGPSCRRAAPGRGSGSSAASIRDWKSLSAS